MKCWQNKVSHLLVLVWMIVIFYFSAQPGGASSDLSGGFVYRLMEKINDLFHAGWDEVTLVSLTAFWEFPVRKVAHMAEYGVLAVLMYFAAGCYEKIKNAAPRVHYVVAFALTVCYAASDEIHQLFVPGRSGMVIDVFVDACGAELALMLIWMLRRVAIKCKTRKS